MTEKVQLLPSGLADLLRNLEKRQGRKAAMRWLSTEVDTNEGLYLALVDLMSSK